MGTGPVGVHMVNVVRPVDWAVNTDKEVVLTQNPKMVGSTALDLLSNGQIAN